MRTLIYWAMLAIGLGASARAAAAPPPALDPDPDAIAAAAPSEETADEPAAPEEPDHELAGSEDADAKAGDAAPADERTAADDALVGVQESNAETSGDAADDTAIDNDGAAADKSCRVEPVTVRRFGAPGDVSLRLTDCAGRPNLAALPQLSQLAQPIAQPQSAAAPVAGNPATRSVQLNPELLVRLQCVVDRFAARSVEIVSGYRPRARVGSRHHAADALDLRIDGVDNLELSEFARTLDATGVGYYPNSTFVHIDVREGTAYWVDRSGPGERAKYVRSDVVAKQPAANEAVAKDTVAIHSAKAAPIVDRVRDKDMIDVASATADESIDGDDPTQVEPASGHGDDGESESEEPTPDPELQALSERALVIMNEALGRDGPVAVSSSVRGAGEN